LAVAEACRRTGRLIPVFEYPCYAPDDNSPRGLRLAAFPAQAAGVRHVELDDAAMRCKEKMTAVYTSQRQVFDLLGWQPSARESFRECSPDRDHISPPYAGLDSYAHWFNWRSRDRFGQLAAAVATVTRARQAEAASG
jgi:hypothetical protein